MSLEIERKEAFKDASWIIENRIVLQRPERVGYVCPKNCYDLERRFAGVVDQLTSARVWPVDILQSDSLRTAIVDMKKLSLKEPNIACFNRWHDKNGRMPAFEATTDQQINFGAMKLEASVSGVRLVDAIINGEHMLTLVFSEDLLRVCARRQRWMESEGQVPSSV